MRKFLILLTVFYTSYLGGFCSAASAEPARPLTLEDCFELARNQSERIQRGDESIRAAEAKYREQLATVYPSIHFLVSQRLRDTTSASRVNAVGDAGSAGINVASKHPFDSALNVRQPVFTGFREFYQMEASQAEISALGHDKQRTIELLYLDLADVFYQIQFYQKDLHVLEKTEGILTKRMKELRDFIELGKSRDSEIQAAESDVANLGSTRARVEGLLGASMELMAFLVGKPAVELNLAPVTPEPPPAILDPLLDQARQRSDIKAAQERITSAEKDRIAAERESWPNLNLEGNAYPYQDPDSERNWDVLLRLDVPLYEGGGIDARIDQQRARERINKLNLRETERVVEREVRIAFSDLQASQKEVERLKTLLEASRKSYDLQRRDYELGVVTNLDVLSAIREVQNAERLLLNAETNVRLNQARLRVASGGVAGACCEMARSAIFTPGEQSEPK